MAKSIIQPFSNKDDIAVFNAIPWCAKLLTDPQYTIVQADPRRFQPERKDVDLFMTETFNTKDTIRECLVLRSTHNTSPMSEVNEILALCDLGPKLSSIRNVAHGGIITVLFDHFTGMLIRINNDVVRLRNPDYEPDVVYMTLKLDTKYRRPVRVPGVVLVRAWYSKVEGRKRWLKARLEDAKGTVLAEGEALYLKVYSKQLKDPGGKL